MNSAFNRAKQLLSAVPELVHPQSNAAISLFSIFTDHKPLTHSLFRTSPPWSARQQRHLAYLAEFTSSIVHIPGKENVVADTLSRPVSPVSAPSFKPGSPSVSPGLIKPCSAPKPDPKPFHLSSKPVQSHALPVPGSKVSETEVSDFFSLFHLYIRLGPSSR